jgi:prolipoprotein diacylglyceryltransferase/Fe-S-cluster containining protein
MSASQPQTSQILSGYQILPSRPDRAHAQPRLPLNQLAAQPSADNGRLPGDLLPLAHADDGASKESIMLRGTHQSELGRGLKDHAYDRLYQQIARGFRYTHFRANANTSELIEVAASLQAAVEILCEKGILVPEDLERRKGTMAERLAERFSQRGMGVSYQPSEHDKYQLENEVVIDCDKRVHLCQAACCKLRFALARQDVEEGLIKWDFANPYIIAQGPDHYCQHLNRQQLNCSVHAHRPMVCRSYDCRQDKRIWLDFEQRIINPRINEAHWPQSLSEPSGDAAGPSASQPLIPGMESSADAPVQQPGQDGLYSMLNRTIQRLTSRPLVYRFGAWIVVSYGVLLSLGFGLGMLYWLYLIGYRFQHTPPSGLMMIGLVIAAFTGSKLLFGLERMIASWLHQSAIRTRGHTMYGGILGSLIFGGYLFSTDLANLLLLLDCAAPAIALGYVCGKMGCLSFGCCVGRPTGARLAVRYTAEISKAVSFYDLRGVPLIPIQLYETLLGIGLFVLLSLQPTTAFGTGQVMGWFLCVFSLGRMILLRFRFRIANEVADPLITDLLNLSFAALGTILLSKAFLFPVNPMATGRVPAEPASLFWSLVVSMLAALLVLYLFGVYRVEAGKP